MGSPAGRGGVDDHGCCVVGACRWRRSSPALRASSRVFADDVLSGPGPPRPSTRRGLACAYLLDWLTSDAPHGPSPGSPPRELRPISLPSRMTLLKCVPLEMLPRPPAGALDLPTALEYLLPRADSLHDSRRTPHCATGRRALGALCPPDHGCRGRPLAPRTSVASRSLRSRPLATLSSSYPEFSRYNRWRRTVCQDLCRGAAR